MNLKWMQFYFVMYSPVLGSWDHIVMGWCATFWEKTVLSSLKVFTVWHHKAVGNSVLWVSSPCSCKQACCHTVFKNWWSRKRLETRLAISCYENVKTSTAVYEVFWKSSWTLQSLLWLFVGSVQKVLGLCTKEITGTLVQTWLVCCTVCNTSNCTYKHKYLLFCGVPPTCLGPYRPYSRRSLMK
jgi:hypothetical protein